VRRTPAPDLCHPRRIRVKGIDIANTARGDLDIQGHLARGFECRRRLMIEIDTGGDPDSLIYFFDHMVEGEVPFDLIGLTYYPFWHGPLSALSNTLSTLADRYEKDVLVAETAYPYTLVDSDDEANVLSSASQLPDGARFPATPTGQHDFFAALREVVLQVPNGRGAGFLVWEPSWRAGVDAGPDHGNAFDNLTLVDADGAALPAIGSFGAP